MTPRGGCIHRVRQGVACLSKEIADVKWHPQKCWLHMKISFNGLVGIKF